MTNEPLKQTPLSVQMADRLQADIFAGMWTDLLPGCRMLAERYGTGLKTSLAALKILEQRKVIEPASQGSRRRIGNPTQPVIGNTSRGMLLILYASDLPMGEQVWCALLGVRDSWQRAGGSVTMAPVNYGRYKQPKRMLNLLIEKHHASALALETAPLAWVEAATTSGWPVYLVGGEWHTVEASGTGFGLRPEIDRVVAELHSLGHRRILFPLEPHLLACREEVISATRNALGAEVREELVDQMCPIFQECVPNVWIDYWKQAFANIHPTAVILLKESHLLSLYGYCAERGIKIPADLSVVHLGYNANLEWCRPAPRQMRYPIQKEIAHFQRWIRNRLRPVGKKLIPLEKIPGASVAKPKGS